MLETKFGKFEVLKNVDDTFDLEKFEARYIEEVYDKYTYILGDMSSEVLRLKGFSNNPNSENYFHHIPDFLIESCVYNVKYYILKRVKEKNSNEE